MSDANLTNKTFELVEQWIRAKNRLRDLESQKTRAVNALTDAENALGEWLVPKDNPEKEPFNIWFGSGIVQATKYAHSYEIKWRKEPDDKKWREMGIGT